MRKSVIVLSIFLSIFIVLFLFIVLFIFTLETVRKRTKPYGNVRNRTKAYGTVWNRTVSCGNELNAVILFPVLKAKHVNVILSALLHIAAILGIQDFFNVLLSVELQLSVDERP